tara:strand:- start:1239 stop:1616 length:378 start_codon:yes stop_codon:yes gene_type:complete
MKAQRAWSNLSPEQKEKMRKTASEAARNAYSRVQDSQGDKQSATMKPQTPPAENQQEVNRESAQTNPQTSPPKPGKSAEEILKIARAQGPQIARQAATKIALRSHGRANQILEIWRRSQRPPSSK